MLGALLVILTLHPFVSQMPESECMFLSDVTDPPCYYQGLAKKLLYKHFSFEKYFK